LGVLLQDEIVEPFTLQGGWLIDEGDTTNGQLVIIDGGALIGTRLVGITRLEDFDEEGGTIVSAGGGLYAFSPGERGSWVGSPLSHLLSPTHTHHGLRRMAQTAVSSPPPQGLAPARIWTHQGVPETMVGIRADGETFLASSNLTPGGRVLDVVEATWRGTPMGATPFTGLPRVFVEVLSASPGKRTIQLSVNSDVVNHSQTIKLETSIGDSGVWTTVTTSGQRTLRVEPDPLFWDQESRLTITSPASTMVVRVKDPSILGVLTGE